MSYEPIQAIPTEYNGHKFRSRLEARWAVFFDTLKVPYEYEKEGYELSGGRRYLPDFWLPSQDCWFEVKPTEPTRDEQDAITALAIGTRKSAYIMFGPIPNPWTLDISGPSIEISGSPAWLLAYNGDPTWDEHHVWCECRRCGKLGLEYAARSARLSCHHYPNEDKVYNGDSIRLRNAYLVARSKQFEY